MTRGDFVLILYRNAGSPSVYGVSNPFTDVKSTDYYYEAVLWAYRNNVVNGTSTTTFGPKGKITREQIASILWRLAGKPVYSASLRSYTDYASVSDYAYDAMSWAVGSGLCQGQRRQAQPQEQRHPRRGRGHAPPVSDSKSRKKCPPAGGHFLFISRGLSGPAGSGRRIPC